MHWLGLVVKLRLALCNQYESHRSSYSDRYESNFYSHLHFLFQPQLLDLEDSLYCWIPGGNRGIELCYPRNEVFASTHPVVLLFHHNPRSCQQKRKQLESVQSICKFTKENEKESNTQPVGENLVQIHVGDIHLKWIKWTVSNTWYKGNLSWGATEIQRNCSIHWFHSWWDQTCQIVHCKIAKHTLLISWDDAHKSLS